MTRRWRALCLRAARWALLATAATSSGIAGDAWAATGLAESPARIAQVPRGVRRVYVTARRGGKELARQWLALPPGQDTIAVTFDKLSPGQIIVTAEGFADQTGPASEPPTEPPLAVGTTVARIVAGQQSRITVRLVSTVAAVQLRTTSGGLPLSEGQRLVLNPGMEQPLIATVLDAMGRQLRGAPVVWERLPGDSDVAQVARIPSAEAAIEARAVVTAERPGTMTVRAREEASMRSASVTVVVPAPELQVSKSADRTTVQLGQVVTYTIVARNNGPGPATGVELFDTLPVGTSLVTDSASDGGQLLGGNTVRWALGTMASGASRTVTFQARVASTPAGTIVNVARVQSAEVTDPVNSNSVTTPVIPPQLQLTMTADRSTAQPGQVINYSITVRNAGVPPTESFPNVQLFAAIPPGTTFQGASDEGRVVAANTVGWTLDMPSIDGTTTVTLSVLVDSAPVGSTITNVAQVRSDLTPVSVDSNSVTTPVIPLQLQLTKSADPTGITPEDDTNVVRGGQISYVIEIRNAGLNTATNVQIREMIPASTTFVMNSDNCIHLGRNCSFVLDGNSLVWTIDSMPSGGTATVSFVVQVPDNTTGGTLITNVAQVQSTESPEPVDSNRVVLTVFIPPG